ncbi:MAG: hypothetical protein ACT4PE_06070 [Candidatus Eiseniibacteriota bacterium]
MSPFLGLSGCINTGFSTYQQCDGLSNCAAVFYTTVAQGVYLEVASSDANGCLFLPSGASCDSMTMCGLTPNTDFSITTVCSDPLLIQWPDAWTVHGATWSNAFPPAASGLVLIEPASNFELAEGSGPIVTSPGYSAYVLRLDMDTFTENTFALSVSFNHGGLPTACVTGVEVAMATVEPGGLRYIAPLAGESLDLASYSAPDAHVLCMPNPTPVQPSAWGWIKSMYR